MKLLACLLIWQLVNTQLLHEGRPAPAVHRVRQDALEIVACVDGLARSRLLVALVDRLRLDKSAGQRVLGPVRSEEHTSELQSLMRISYAVFCLKKKKTKHNE